jgi:hypothetical protein
MALKRFIVPKKWPNKQSGGHGGKGLTMKTTFVYGPTPNSDSFDKIIHARLL